MNNILSSRIKSGVITVLEILPSSVILAGQRIITYHSHVTEADKLVHCSIITIIYLTFELWTSNLSVVRNSVRTVHRGSRCVDSYDQRQGTHPSSLTCFHSLTLLMGYFLHLYLFYHFLHASFVCIYRKISSWALGVFKKKFLFTIATSLFSSKSLFSCTPIRHLLRRGNRDVINFHLNVIEIYFGDEFSVFSFLALGREENPEIACLCNICCTKPNGGQVLVSVAEMDHT